MIRCISLFLILFPLLAFSQNETDLYRYSRTTYGGSARFESMAGSFGALGADMSCSQTNPAGMGRFSSSKAEMTFFGARVHNQSNFNQTVTSSGIFTGGLSNIGIVITTDASTKPGGILYQQLGLGMNRIESFRNTFNYQGAQFESLLDGFADQAEGIEPASLNDYFPFSTFVAYQTYALDYYAPTQSYYSLLNSGDVYHDRTVETYGGQNELFISYSINYINRLYVGSSIGFRYHQYEEAISHKETLTDTSNTPLRSFEYNYHLNTSGWGTNLKVGAIYLVNESLRTGFAFHSPTFGELTDSWSANMTSHFQDSTVYLPSHLVPAGNYRYRIRNPIRLIGSLAYVFSTRGCINIDLEYIDYRMAHFKSTKDKTYLPYSYSAENDYAKTVFRPALNVRLGGEYIVASILYLRGGIAYYPKAFKEEIDIENSGDFLVTTGAGIKTKRFYVDLALKFRSSSKNYNAFYGSEARINSFTQHVFLSAGFTL